MIEADLLLTNANVLTLDIQGSRAGSVAVTNGRISGIWKEQEPPRHTVIVNPKTQVLNLKGRTLIPGFVDTHNHLLMYAEMRKQANCSSPLNRKISDIVERIRAMSEVKSKEEWIIGWGYDDTLLEENRHPTREDLDRAAPHHPVFIRHISGHLAVVNSVAINLAGIDDNISNPPGGHFGRDGAGKLNGVLYEPAAMEFVSSKIPILSTDTLVSFVGEAAQEYLTHGITMNTEAAIGLFQGITEWDVHLKAVEQGVNPMRMQLMVMQHLLRSDSHFGSYTANELDLVIRGRTNGRARLDSAKMFQDGSIQGLTGALREPYHCNSQLYGDLINDQEPFNLEVLDLHKRGYRIAIHGNGDRAIGSILDAYEFALKQSPMKDHRHRIEHVQTASLDDLDRMKNMEIAGSFFINHVYYWGDRHKRIFLGPERAERISPLADAIQRKLLFTLHSDCPITPISPLFSVWAAVNRLTREGAVLGAEQKCDVETALRSMTIYGSRLNFDEKESGSIEWGKRADFAVLAEDPTRINPLDIKDIPVVSTIIDGLVVYERN